MKTKHGNAVTPERGSAVIAKRVDAVTPKRGSAVMAKHGSVVTAKRGSAVTAKRVGARSRTGERRFQDLKHVNSSTPLKIRPTTKRTLRGLGGRRVLLEGFGHRAPVFIAITAGGSPPIGAWLSQTELRRLVEAAKRILR